MRNFTIVIVALLLAACASRPDVSIDVPFDEASTAAQLKDGPNTIKGSALFRQQGGGVVTCAGFPVSVFPATPYAKARMSAIYGSAHGGLNPVAAPVKPNFRPDPPAYSSLVREARCDAQGFFRFERLMNGEFYVIVPIVWQVGYASQGGFLSTLVTLKDGETRDVVLAR